MRSRWFRVGTLWWQWRDLGLVVSDSVREPSQRAAAQRPGVFPTLPEHGLHVTDGRSADGELYVVPRRSRPVPGRHRLGLLVTPVRCVVAAAAAQVDATEERDIKLGSVVVAKDDKLLVVRPSGPHPHVPETLAAGGIDLFAQVPVLGGRERQAVPVGAPDQAANIHAALGRVREHRSDFLCPGRR